MATTTPLTAQAGLPWDQPVRVVDGKDIWANLVDFEVRMQVRKGTSETDALVVDLTPHLDTVFDGNDIVVTISMTGAETRALQGGYYDMVASDVGVTDAQAVKLLYGKLSVEPIVTAAS